MAFREKITVAIDFVTDGATSGIGNIKSAMAGAEGGLNKFRAGSTAAMDEFRKMGVVGAAAIGTALVPAAKMAVDAATDLGESVNAVNVTFGEAADGILALGENAAEAVGLSNAEFNGLAVQFSAFAKTVAGEGGDVVGTIDQLSKRAADFASVMNIDVAEAARLFQSGLAGETEPLRRYGKDLSAAAVTAHAYSEGIAEVGSKLTESQKVQARYSLLMKQTADVQGDFANTSDSLANQQRVLKAELTNTAAALGTVLVPELQRAADTALTTLDAFNKLKDSRLGGWAKNVWDNVSLNAVLESSVKKFGELVEAGRNAGAHFADFASNFTKAQETIDASIRDALVEQHTEAISALADNTMTAMDAISDSIADAGEEFAKSEEWWSTYEANVNDAVEGARGSFTSFTDEALSDLGRFKDELAFQAGSMQTWQDNLLTIASGTSGDFASYLADMGAAGQGLVAELADNPKELKIVYGEWITLTQVSMRDMGDEFRKAEQYGGEAIDATDATIQKKLKDSAVKSKASGTAIGTAIGQGIAQGIGSQSPAVSAAAAGAVTDALAAAKAAGKIESPSRLFAEEVGQPIVEGIEEGIVDDADKIGDALGKAIESAEKDALSAVDDLVDAASDRFSDAWGDIGDHRSLEDLQQRTQDAERNLAEVNADSESTLLDKERATRRVEDAYYAVLKASQSLLSAGPAGEAQFRNLADAAGLERAEIDRLVSSYRQLESARHNAAVQSAAIAAEADQAQAVRAEFGQLAAAGFFNKDQLSHLSQFSGDPSMTLSIMREYIAMAQAFIAGQLPKFHGGGVVPGSPGSDVPIMAQAGEVVLPNGARGAPTILVDARGAIGLSGPQVEQWVAEALTRWKRRNGER
jgi:hypothetical protein